MTTLSYAIHCQYSGLEIANLEYQVVAGHMPYLSHWDKMVAMHPIFSFPTGKLLAFARGEWKRLAKAADDGDASRDEEESLRVCFLAVLHSLDSIKQEAPSLPPMHIVQNNMSKLFALAYWHHYLDSKRFAFPSYKINKANQNIGFDGVHDYLELCFEIKDDYENGVSDLVEAEKAKSAEAALKALRNSWIIPASNKQLWRWVAANLPEKYAAEKEGWLSTLFLGSERTILTFDKDEIQLLDEIIISECPPGTGILKAVRDRLDSIMQVHTDNKEAFTVDFDEYLPLDEDASLIQSPLSALSVACAVSGATGNLAQKAAPVQADFPTKAGFIRANAMWYLQCRAVETRAAKNASQVGAL